MLLCCLSSSVEYSPPQQQREENQYSIFFFSELCWGEAMGPIQCLKQGKKEESERIRGERYQIEFIEYKTALSMYRRGTL